METLFEPKVQPKELKVMERRAHRTPDEYSVYHMIPSSETMARIMNGIALLNHAIKFPDCPIRKTPFYQLKTRLIQYILTIIKAGQAPADWSYKFNGVEVAPENPGHFLVAVEIYIGDKQFQFHSPIDNPLMCILYDECYKAPIQDFRADPHRPLDITKTIEIWEDLLKDFEDANWFVYERQPVHGWVGVMSSWYPHLKIKMQKGTNCKVATMLKGGPMMQINGRDWCKFNELRDNFSAKLDELGHKHDFKLNLKKPQ